MRRPSATILIQSSTASRRPASLALEEVAPQRDDLGERLGVEEDEEIAILTRRGGAPVDRGEPARHRVERRRLEARAG